ncbi:peptidase M13 [Novosphingobium sp. FSY-8]|uniref:Peptidase M13 n=2 Tax=Novosphingobium ovatum TaxID=1908523 RepID=A0ABW9XG60_9SPHN|nr:peptidase M13 [Novosphingobium ovatum]
MLALSIAVSAVGAAVAVPLAAQGTGAAVASTAKAAFGSWGVDLGARDTAVRPGDDFERYVNGHWIDTTPIEADRPNAGTFYDLRENVQGQIKGIITQAPAGTQYGALYASFMDEARLETLGLKPLMADLAVVRAIKDKTAFARHMGGTMGRFGNSLIGFDVMPDTVDPTINVLGVGQSGLGLPERDYYLNPRFKPQLDAYTAYVERTLKAIGYADPAAGAKTILAFETQIAKRSWDIASRRDLDKLNNPMSSAELAAYAPGLDWGALFAGAHIAPQKRMIVGEKTAVRDLAALYGETPLATLKLWQMFHIANQASPYLNKAMVDSQFEYTKTLSGVQQIRPRWKRGVDLVNGSLGEMVGQTYVAKYFTPQAKAKMEVLVANLKLAMGDRIRANSWMSAPTKAAALDKLSRMDVMVGYPDKWRSYVGLKIVAGDLYGNVQRAGAFNAAYYMADLGQKVDRKKWAMSPQTVNAYNGGLENKIVFPAAILQPPFFDLNADDAVNYGAIGAVIGHEISHGFDDQGRKIDATGAVRDWWTAEDGKRFEAEAKAFGAQYAAFEVLPGVFINPDLTMGENIADFAGVQVALDAYRRSLNGQAAPALDGVSGDQRFFLAYAQVWRAKRREDALRNQVATDPHSPSRYRILGPLRNVEAWYTAFGVQPADKMFIAPEKRVKIW